MSFLASRRGFIGGAVATAALTRAGWAQTHGGLEQPPLPYAFDALEPHIGRETMDLHYTRHHAGYVRNVQRLVAGTPLAGQPLDEIVLAAYRTGDKALIDNAGQHWNHNLFWRVMKKDAGEPEGELKRRIEHDFGGVDKMKEAFKAAAVGQFGSGWAWLVLDGDKLDVMKTPNGENPLMHGKKALFGVDVWEHAYYLDYRNRRPDYVQAWLDHLVNWQEVAKNLG